MASDSSSVRSISTEDLSVKAKKLKLYSYWRSSCAHRVRIVLNLKGLEYEYKAVNLLVGEQFSPEFEKVNPVRCIPALTDGDVTIADSFAIILYLEEKYPEHPLLPNDLAKRALNYQIASIVCSSIQPLQSQQVLKIIEEKLDSDQSLAWAKHHVESGFTAIEKLLAEKSGKYATGNEVSMADVFLAPQISNGISRFEINMSPFPTLARLHEVYSELPEFRSALPQFQPDAPSNI